MKGNSGCGYPKNLQEGCNGLAISGITENLSNALPCTIRPFPPAPQILLKPFITLIIKR